MLFVILEGFLFCFERIHITGKHLRVCAIQFVGRYGSLAKLFKPLFYFILPIHIILTK